VLYYLNKKAKKKKCAIAEVKGKEKGELSSPSAYIVHEIRQLLFPP
jgi:hypothetical protein